MSSPDEPVRPVRARAATHRRRRWARVRSLPPALGVLLVAIAFTGLAWAILVPPFQAPDETSHFAYAQSLATRFALPGQAGRPLGSTNQLLADQAVRASSLAFDVGSVRPQWNPQSFRAYVAEARKHPSQSDGGGPNAASVNPPLFYLYSDLAYWASSTHNLFGSLYAMRAWGVLLLLANVVGGWLLAGEVFGRRRLAQLVCAAVCGLVPTETFISTSVNPDALMVPLWTFDLWLGARLIRRGWRTGEAVALCVVAAAAILTKATSYALLPAVLAALALAWWQAPAAERRARLRGAGLALVALIAPVLAWVAVTKSQGRPAVNAIHARTGAKAAPGFTIGGFLNYLWQFYLPRLPFLAKRTQQPLGVYGVWVKQGWATFGWLDVQLAQWAYPVLGAVTAVVGVVNVAILVLRRRAARLGLLAFFALALLALLIGLHVTDYRSLLNGEGALLQGRYLLPVIGLFGLAVAQVVAKLPPRWRGMTAGAVLALLLLLQVLSLATIAKTYYT